MAEENLETGLRGVPVGYCTTSYVDPQKGLFYIDKPVSELTHWSPLQVLYLLHEGHEGTEAQVASFAQRLEGQACCRPEVIQAIEALPRAGHPMSLFAVAVLIAGMFEATSDYRADGFRLIAQLPHLVATVINHHAGWGKTSPPEPGQGYVENFVQLLRVPDKRAKELTHLLNLFYLLHLDHGGGNLSTFVGKAVASGLEDMYGSISSALCALAGPRHGRANQEALEMVQRVLKSVGAAATEGTVETFLRDLVARGGLVSGFGHAVLRVEDPRATVQYAFAEKHYPQDALVRTALLIRGAGPKVLKKNPKIADPYPNVDAISGVLLSAAGFSYPEYYAVLFGFARSAGIAIQIIYERCEARGGKGTPIVRPKYIFKKR